MKEELSQKMKQAIEHMKRNNNKMVRFPGGYWAREGWHAWNGPCWGTPTIEGIVRRGYGEYTSWVEGRKSKFPVECSLTKRALDAAIAYCQHADSPSIEGHCPYCGLPKAPHQ